VYISCLVPLIILIAAYFLLRRKKGVDPEAKLIYLIVFFLEIPGSVVRAAIASLAATIVLTPLWIVMGLIVLIYWGINYLAGNYAPPIKLIIASYAIGGLIVSILALIGGFGPLVWSLLCMLGLKGGHRETAWEMNARKLSKTREAVYYGHKLAHILSLAKRNLDGPAAVFAIDSPLPRAWTVGSTLFMTSSLLKGEHLMGLISRNLYYLQSGDARFCLAMRRFVMPPAYIFSRFKHHLAPGNLAFSLLSVAEERYAALAVYITTFVGALAGGGIGIVFMNYFIVRYLRKAQTRANIWATDIGLGSPLVTYYDHHAYFDFAVPYIYRPFSSTELQIDDILRWQRGERWKI
jgi:hypothetical protein